MKDDLEGLSYEVIEAQPQPFDFSTGFGERWEIALPLTEKEWEEEAYAPIYNFIYPLGAWFKVPRDFRRRLSNTTVVRVDDAHHLALTGCGMDFTWEICESYLNLGYFPPAHFCRLPAMAGRGDSTADRRVIRGCLESIDSLVSRYQSTNDYLRRMLH